MILCKVTGKECSECDFLCNSKTSQMYRYYLLERPPGMGCQPKGVVIIQTFVHKDYVKEIDRKAWGWVEYAEPLTAKQVEEYELMEAKE